jgi:hypothetical protein
MLKMSSLIIQGKIIRKKKRKAWEGLEKARFSER